VQAPAELSKDLVLVGGGHSHALALRMLAMKPVEGLRITLISPSSHTPYSGMLPGLIAGHYVFEDTHIDLSRLCQWAGVRFICAEVTGLDTENRRLTLGNRPPVGYDLLSLDIGSQPELESVPGAAEFAVPVKPVATLWQRWQALDQQLATHNREQEQPYRIGIVGGGAGSVELALAIAHRISENDYRNVAIDLWCGANEILNAYNSRARATVMGELAVQGVKVHLDARVARVSQEEIEFSNGECAGYGTLFWCTGGSAAAWIKTSGLETDEQGFLAIDETLQSLSDPRVFGAGDIATLISDPRPKAGVYAVRQAPVLAYNLRATLFGKRLQVFRPQRRFLSLLSLGAKHAVADKGLFTAKGKWVWRWKDRIDREFMQRFSGLSVDMGNPAAELLPENDPNPQLNCGGCGAKVGAQTLSNVLEDLSGAYPEHCTGNNDDAAAIPLDSSPSQAVQPVLQSIDILRQIVADPWVMGRIAANHALSDLYACGARPVSALAAMTLPFATAGMLERDLRQLLAGALEEFSAVNCKLTGGHSMQGSELQLGFTVNGVPIKSETVLGKTGLREGDALVLTKPLGTGTLFAAHMQLAADGRDISAAVDSMMQSNYLAARLAVEHGAHACTDITGFGLLGHLKEMLGKGWRARLRLRDIPLIAGARCSLAQDRVSTAHWDNVASYGHVLKLEADVDRPLANIVFDPQTSGGLLIALPAENAERLSHALLEGGHPQASIIGSVESTGQGVAQIVLS
jgi:selenide, water dikinase